MALQQALSRILPKRSLFLRVCRHNLPPPLERPCLTSQVRQIVSNEHLRSLYRYQPICGAGRTSNYLARTVARFLEAEPDLPTARNPY